MLQLRVIASNKNFCGKVDVYDHSECLLGFATLLSTPLNDLKLSYEAGEKDGYGYFSMRYYPIGLNGHIGLEINLESNVATDYRKEEKDKLKIEIIVEPSQIDIFQKELYQMAKTESGKATLYGRDNKR